MLLLVFVIGSSTFADLAAAKLVGWQLERGVDSPSYAVTEPTRTDLNIDTVALVCEGTDENRVVQLQLYLSDDGPLRPKNAGSQRFKVEPRAELLIDGRLFKVSILFADNYVVLADGRQGPFPRLSDAVLDAMAAGKRMVMRFDLMAERPGQAAAFDGEAVVDLQSGAGAAAVSAVRRCAEPEPGRPVGTAFAG
jgi:hypothetical protein